MYTLYFSSKFKRGYKKLRRSDPLIAKRISKTLEKLRESPHHPGLKSHVTGRDRVYGNIWSSWVTRDIRVIWVYDKSKDLVIVLLKIGGHNDVY